VSFREEHTEFLPLPSMAIVCRRVSAALARSSAYVPALGTREKAFAAGAFPAELPARLMAGSGVTRRPFVGTLALPTEANVCVCMFVCECVWHHLVGGFPELSTI